MNAPLACWNPKRWYRELRHVWHDTRLLVLTAQIAAIYAAILIPFKVGIPIIPGFVELRPANVIPLVSSLLFGPAAAWGAGIGNVIGDCFGTLGPASVFGFVGNFLYGYVPYLLWGNMVGLSAGTEPVVRTWRQGAEYVVVCIGASFVCAATIGWGVELLGLLPFWLLAPAIFFNNLVMSVLLGPPLLLFLYPRVKQWNLLYRDFAQKEEIGWEPDVLPEAISDCGETAREESPPPSDVMALSGLSFRPFHADQPILKNISLTIRKGEFVVLMGRTGAGKSSLCYALNGLIPQFLQGEYEGTVQVGGRYTTHSPVWEQANRIGLVFQDFETQLVSTNVETELRYALEATRDKQIPPLSQSVHQHIQNTLKRVGLAGLERRDPFSLSGGQRQRLVMASVLVREPPVIVLDQPLTDLDPAGRRQFLHLLSDLRKKGQTILIAEHGVEDLLMADRVCVLDQGALVWEGPPRDLVAYPELAKRHGVSPYPLAECFSEKSASLRPATVEEAWALSDRLGLGISSTPEYHAVSLQSAHLADHPLIELKNVSFSYRSDVLALNRVSLSIQAGEFLAILGQNGSGKSTLAKLLNGLLLPSEGHVLVSGMDTRDCGVGKLASIVGHVFQNPDHQIFAETVRKEVAFGARNAGCSPEECERRVHDALQAVGLTGAEEHDPFSLTKGERQRVAVASILAAQPQVLVIDEPTTGLDAEESERMMTMIRALNEQGHTLVMITHDMRLVATYARRCLLMKNGEILADGPTRTIFSDPSVIEAAALELPALTKFSQRWGATLLTVDEVRKALQPL